MSRRSDGPVHERSRRANTDNWGIQRRRKMETRMNYEALADATDFGSIRRHLVRAKSPLRGVWFVASEELLSQVAALLDADSDRSPTLRQSQLEVLLQGGQLRAPESGL